MSKEVVASVEVTNEIVDKFHRALCPICNGRCRRFGASCEYDYKHTKEQEPEVNKYWRKYIDSLHGETKKYDMTLDEAYDLLAMWNVPEDKREVVYKMQQLFNEIE